MVEWLPLEEFHSKFRPLYCHEGLVLEDRLSVKADLASVSEMLNAAPCYNPPGFDEPGPSAAWFGSSDDKPIMIIWHYKCRPQFGVVSLQKFVPALDKYKWSVLTELESLPKQMFNSITGVLSDGTGPDPHFIIGRFSFERRVFTPVYGAETEEEGEALISLLANLGSKDNWEILPGEFLTPLQMRRVRRFQYITMP